MSVVERFMHNGTDTYTVMQIQEHDNDTTIIEERNDLLWACSENKRG